MKIASVARALPPYRYSQQEIFEALAHHWRDKIANPAQLSRFHHRVGVDTRYLVMPFAGYVNLTRWGDANRVWLEKAEELGEEAIDLALKRAGMGRDCVSALLTVSVTGIASPSLDAHLANRMGLPATMRRTPIFGLGCVAGASGIAQAADYVRAYPDRMAVLLSVELCSLTFQRNDLSIPNLISSGLFGDGAAAVVVAGDDVSADGPEIVDTASSFYANTEDAMGWDISEEGFRIVLSAEVPADYPGEAAGRCRCISGAQWIDARRCGELGAAHRRPQGAGGNSGLARAGSRNVRCVVGFAARRGEPFVRFCAAGAGGDYAEPPAGAGHMGCAGGAWPGVLRATGSAPMVKKLSSSIVFSIFVPDCEIASRKISTGS